MSYPLSKFLVTVFLQRDEARFCYSSVTYAYSLVLNAINHSVLQLEKHQSGEVFFVLFCFSFFFLHFSFIFAKVNTPFCYTYKGACLRNLIFIPSFCCRCKFFNFHLWKWIPFAIFFSLRVFMNKCINIKYNYYSSCKVPCRETSTGKAYSA